MDRGRQSRNVPPLVLPMMREALEGFEGDVVLEHFPPYTQELNPMEVQWG